MTIRSGATVEIHYELLDERGNVLESTRDEGPVRYTHGNEEILPGLEKGLEGRAEGDRLELELAPEEAYGPHDPAGIVAIPRSELPAELELAPGETIAVGLEAEDPAEEIPEDEREMELRVVEVSDEEVICDANHPLAGRAVTFRVEVVRVEARQG